MQECSATSHISYTSSFLVHANGCAQTNITLLYRSCLWKILKVDMQSKLVRFFFAYYIYIIWTDSSQLAHIVNQYGYTKRTNIEEPMNKIKSENHNSSHQCADAQIRYIQSITIVFWMLCLTIRTTSHLYALDSVGILGIWTSSNFFGF